MKNVWKLVHYIPPFCHGYNTCWRHFWAASCSTVRHCQGWCSDAAWGQVSSRWYQAQEKLQTPRYRNHNSTDHLQANLSVLLVYTENKCWVKRRERCYFTKGSCHSQEGDLVNYCASSHWAVMGQSGSLPHNAVHTRFLHHATITWAKQVTLTQADWLGKYCMYTRHGMFMFF